MAKMLQAQSTMIQLHRELIDKGNISHINRDSSKEYTEFENSTYVLLEPAIGKPIDRLHSRRIGPFLVLGHTGNAYTLRNLVSQKEFKVNIHRICPFNFDEERVDPQEVAAHDDEEFVVESVLEHKGDFSKKNTLVFKIRWLGYAQEEDS